MAHRKATRKVCSSTDTMLSDSRKRMQMLTSLFIEINNLKKVGYSPFYKGRVVQNPCVRSRSNGWELQLGNNQWYRYSCKKQSILVTEISSGLLHSIIRALPLPEDLIPILCQYLTKVCEPIVAVNTYSPYPRNGYRIDGRI